MDAFESHPQPRHNSQALQAALQGELHKWDNIRIPRPDGSVQPASQPKSETKS